VPPSSTFTASGSPFVPGLITVVRPSSSRK
jgi:hypothetical protein